MEAEQSIKRIGSELDVIRVKKERAHAFLDSWGDPYGPPGGVEHIPPSNP